MSDSNTVMRHDIQALRGIAVLVVLFFHAGFSSFSAGYLGVDIFFVISGYLITGMIAKGLREGSFTFRSFYARRARRLLPAAYVLLLVTIFASFFLLTEEQFAAFREQVLGSVTFTANLFLWKQSNYFDAGSDFKPLLHMWSLSIEEQFYLLIPFALFILPRKFWLPLLVIAVGVSLALCLYFVGSKPTGAFYLIVTRAWEMGIGSIGAMVAVRSSWRPVLNVLVWPALAVVLFVPAFWTSSVHPGLGAVLVCVATILVILSQHEKINGALPTKALGKVGDISYSLYLVHWPLFAFAHNVYLGEELSLPVRLSLLLLSFALALPLYRVEEMFRHAKGERLTRLIKTLLVASVVIIALPFLLGTLRQEGYEKRLEKNVGLGDGCYEIGIDAFNKTCLTGDAPDVMLWGDSFAMHLGAGMAAEAKNGIVQTTLASCGPFVGLAHYTPPNNPPEWSKKCIAFNDKALQYAKDNPAIKIVVISSPFYRYLDTEQTGILRTGDGFNDIKMQEDIALTHFMEGVEKLRAAGKKVVLFGPPPSSGYNIGMCLERKQTGLLTLGMHADCTVSVKEWKKNKSIVYSFVERIKTETDVPVIDPSAYLCESGTCKTEWNDAILYRDEAHLSVEGAKAIFKNTDVMKRIYTEAQ